MSRAWRFILLAVVLGAFSARAGDTLVWSTNKNTVAVDIKDWDLVRLLKKISVATGWHVFMEPGMTRKVTATFKGATTDEALNRLLGNINFTKDSSNGIPRLFVYRTVARAATEAMEPAPKDYRIPNELIVRLKRNSTNTIEELAKKTGATIAGRDDRLKLYRLQFADAAAADAAKSLLDDDGSVGMVDSNYVVERPAPVQTSPVGGVVGPTFGTSPFGSAPGAGNQVPAINPKPTSGGPIIGLIDTAVQMQSGYTQYSLQPLSVVGQPNEPTDQISHGTSMFETMLQNMPQNPSRILPVDVYPGGESTTTFELGTGMVDAINSGASIISISSGGTGDSALLQSIVNEAAQKNILIVAAAGNTPGTALTYPAAYQGVLGITASDPNGKLASYADDGPFVQAMMPGTSIVSLNGQSWQVEGTSPATAAASATIAQYMNQQHITAAQAVAELIQNHPPPPRQ